MKGTDLFPRVPLFEGISPADRATLSNAAQLRTYRRGDIIVRQGQPGESFFVIVRGRVAVTILSPEGREVVLNSLGEGDHFGEMALLDDEPRSATVVAQERSDLAILSRDVFLDLLRSNFVLTRALLRLSRRGSAAPTRRSRGSPRSTSRAGSRATSGSWPPRADGRRAGGWSVVVRPSQREIADTIGSSARDGLAHDVADGRASSSSSRRGRSSTSRSTPRRDSRPSRAGVPDR